MEPQYLRMAKFFPSGLTTIEELNEYGLSYLGTRFKGAFPRSGVPRLDDEQDMMIVNTQDYGDGHWIAIYRDKESGIYYAYDSFGKCVHKHFPELKRLGFLVCANRRQIQFWGENCCGSYCLCWLFGIKESGIYSHLNF